MGQIAFETAAFPVPAAPLFRPPQRGVLQVSMAQLVRAAITVGATPVALGATPRPLIELCWRATMAAATLAEDPRRGWVRTRAYERLDPSEKSAVSYFLGMTQAKITCEALLGVPHLVHLDAVVALLGYPASRRTRPDFLGFDLATMSCTLAVEAKGRSGEFDWRAACRAKVQACSLPRVIGTSSALRVASLAYFEDRAWRAYLEDPESTFDELSDRVTIELLLVAYYRPLVAVLRTVGVRLVDRTADDALVSGELPGMDLTLSLPVAIVDAFGDDQLVGPVDAGRIEVIGSTLKELVPTLYNRAQRIAEDQTRGLPVGLDGVQVDLGTTWLRGDRG